MEKNCEIRKFIKPNELVDIFYKFIIENNIYNKYQKKLRESKHVEVGNVTYLINEVSKTKTAKAYVNTPLYVLSFKDGEDFNYWIDNIMISWQSYISKYLCKIEKIALLIRFLRENNITKKFKTKLMFDYSFFEDSEYNLINVLKRNMIFNIDITKIISFESREEYQFWENIQEKWQNFYDNFSRR